MIVLPFRLASALRRKYRQRTQYGVDTASGACSGTATADCPDSDYPRPAQQIQSNNSAVVAGAGSEGMAGDTSAASEASVTRQATASLVAPTSQSWASASSSASASASALPPFAATLGYEPRDFSRRELDAITQHRLHVRRLSWGSDRSRRYDSAGASGGRSGDGDVVAAVSLSAEETKEGEDEGGTAGCRAEQPMVGDVTNVASVRDVMGYLFGASPVSTAAAAAVAAMPTVGSGRILSSLPESGGVDEVRDSLALVGRRGSRTEFPVANAV